MERNDYLKPEDVIQITILGPEDNCIYKTQKTGWHRLETAISDTISSANLNLNPEDCVFKVENITTGVSHKYRINAHGNLKLIV